ncbi:MAG: hypothetical protein ACYS9X_11170 [Planctomycetota bacterium]|jgi:hypothetical protein
MSDPTEVSAVVQTVAVDMESHATLFRFNSPAGFELLTITGAGVPFKSRDDRIIVGDLDLPGRVGNSYGHAGISNTTWGERARHDPSMPQWKYNRASVWCILRAPPETMNAIADYVREYAWTYRGGLEDAQYRWDFHWPIYDTGKEGRPCKR